MLSLRRRVVLVAGDDDDARIMVATLLTRQGYKVVTARNGAEALASVRRWHPCLVLLDLETVERDEGDFRRQQERDPSTAEIPVLLVSAAADAPARARAIAAAGVVRKPIELARLLRSVRMHCGLPCVV